jgi:hypothetical protein
VKAGEMIIAFYPGGGGNRFLKRAIGEEWSSYGISYDKKIKQQYWQPQPLRYLLDTQLPDAPSEYILTHCMNSKKIQQTFPGHNIVFINSHLQSSLRREWAIAGHDNFMTKKLDSGLSRLEHYNSFKDSTWPEITTQDQLNSLPANILDEVNHNYNLVMCNSVPDTPGILEQLTQKYIDEINSSYEIITWHLEYYQKFPVDFSGASQVVDIDLDQSDFSLVMQQELKLYQSQVFDQVWEKINEQ